MEKLHPEGNVDSASNRYDRSQKEIAGEPGDGFGFAAGCLRLDGEGAIGGGGFDNRKPGVGVVGL